MEYSVGSLADLISGSDYPNKVKVVEKKLKRKEVKIEDEPAVISKIKSPQKIKLYPTQLNQTNIENSNLKRKLKRNLDTSTNGDLLSENDFNNTSENDAGSVVKPKKKKKSNMVVVDEDGKPQVKESEEKSNIEISPEEAIRTIFVGNVPINIKKKKLNAHFQKYGPIESIRIRGISVADPNTPKKVAAIKKEFHPSRNSAIGYIKFINKEDAIKAQEENGVLFHDHHLRVHTCSSEADKPDESRAIFIGNLPFNVEDEDLWKEFKSCGPISYVRIVRHSQTGMGKGFAYVNFQNSDSVLLALEMENVKVKDRLVRISLCNVSMAKKKQKNNNKNEINKAGKPKNRRKRIRTKENKGTEVGGQSQGERQRNNEFQGAKFNDKNKKKKINQGLLEKKQMAQKIAPKSK